MEDIIVRYFSVPRIFSAEKSPGSGVRVCGSGGSGVSACNQQPASCKLTTTSVRVFSQMSEQATRRGSDAGNATKEVRHLKVWDRRKCNDTK